jgi:hypothetical protein
VYVRSGWLFDGSRVRGSLTVRRRLFGVLWCGLGTRAPQPPGSITAFPSLPYPTERGNSGYTLNFVIPASMMCGALRLDVRVESRIFFFFTVSSTRQVYITATLRQTLRLAGIMVGYSGPASSQPGAPTITLPTPTLADLQTTSAWALLTFPVQSAATYRSAGSITWTLPLTDPPSCSGCCTPNWLALNAAVQAVRVADGNRTDVLYYGLLATGIPMGPIVGCNSGGVSTGSNGEGITMAHELGHACGRPHSPCGTPGDALYPAYEPYDPAGTPMASIGEYGLDISTGIVMSPSTHKDFMSYCWPKWISLYVNGRLTNNPALDPVETCVDWPWWPSELLYDRTLIPEKWLPDPPPDPTWLQRDVAPQPLISIIGVQQGPDELEIRSVVRLEAVGQVQNGRALDMRAELIDGKGQVIASATVYSLKSLADSDCGCDDATGGEAYPRLIQAFVPDAEPGAALRIRHGERELWSRRGTRQFKLGGVKVDLVGDEVRVSWSLGRQGTETSECWVQWSADEGRTWQALGASLRGGSATLDARAMPAGKVAIRLLVSDGFRTVTSDQVAVTAPRRPLQPSILSPRDGQTILSPGTLRLWGTATDPSGVSVADEQATWLIDDKEVATGFDVFAAAPGPGEHRATLAVGGKEDSTTRTVSFTVVEFPIERDDDEQRASGSRALERSPD